MQLIPMNQINQLKTKMNIPQDQMPMQGKNNILGVQPMIPMPMPMPLPLNMYEYPNLMIMQTL